MFRGCSIFCIFEKLFVFRELFMTKETITPIVVAFTPNYFLPAMVCISSVLEHSPLTAHYEVICLATEEIPQEQQRMLKGLAPDRLSIRYLSAPRELDDIAVPERFGKASLYRLMLPELLPEYDKVIYHDCDMIIRQDLSALYREIELDDDTFLAAVAEPTLSVQRLERQRLGIPEGQYLNSGFLVMNLKTMRRDHISEKLIQEVRRLDTLFLDQDALNVVCKGHIRYISPIYNSIRTMFLPQYKAEFLKIYTESDWQQIAQEGNIHYTGAKPWNHRTIELVAWWQQYDRLPEEIKSHYPPPRKLYKLYLMELNPVMGCVLSWVKSIKRFFHRG